ncbi:MAG TPA: hypothetical protein VEC12_09825, partial [Bacteroidia bacterium]|nr:hypothetical protein [Bacteroidia bacterium]
MKPAFILALCLFLLLSFSLKANHSMGGDLTYKYLSGESWLVTLKAYRDCHGDPYATPYLKVVSGCGTDSFAMVQKSVTDITPSNGFCPGNTHCADTTFKYGVEEIIFEYTITLNDTCCNYTLSWTDCCRSNGITGPANLPFYLEAKLNRCLHNSSPTFALQPRSLLPWMQPATISFHATDPEGDTLTYEMVSPLLNASTAYTYPGSFSAQRPMTFLGYPNAAQAYPSGLQFDVAGNLMFTPVALNQMSHMAIKVKQWKTINGTLTNIGEITRDMVFIVVPNGGNNTPEFPGYNTVLEFCRGTTSCKTIELFDTDTTDTVSVSITHAINGLTYTQRGTPSRPVIELCYTPDSAATASGEDQYFKITATDGKCSTPGYSERNYIVRQKPELPDSFSIEKIQACYDVSFALQNSSSHTSGIAAAWILTAPSGKLSYANIPAFNRNLTETGWHKLSLTIS